MTSAGATSMDPSPIVIRPIRADDKEILVGGLHRLSPESRYRRFFAPKAKLSATQLRYLTDVDHHTHEALVAIDPRTGEGVGVARFIRSPTEPCDAEAAVAVVDAWHGCGVATALLEALVARAREEGVTCFTASVLVENAAMLNLIHELGDTTVVQGGAGVVELRIDLRHRAMPEGLAHTVRAAARRDVTVRPGHPVVA